MCSPCGPMVCYKYEDCGPALQCLPRSAFKRNGLQDCQFFQQGSIRYLCRTGPCCPKPCPPCCPPCVRRPPPGKTYKGKSQEGQASRAEEGGAKKKDESENQLKRTKSRELRGGIMYYSCHCIKRNGLQHDCRRTGCGGEPACLVLPDPVCAPSQLARARGLADPAPFAAHYAAAAGGGAPGQAASGSPSDGKRFIVCELKGIVPDAGGSKGEKCCKCPCPSTQDSNKSTQPAATCAACFLTSVPAAPSKTPANSSTSRCPCKPGKATGGSESGGPAFVLDEKTIDLILKLEDKELSEPTEKGVVGPGGRIRKPKPPVVEKPCTRPGCVHWQPPPPCVWDLPCKADCFETPPGIQPGRNPLKSGGGGWISKEGELSMPLSSGPSARATSGSHKNKMKLLTPECCTGCSGAGGGGVSAPAGGPPAGLPVLVMKLC